MSSITREESEVRFIIDLINIALFLLIIKSVMEGMTGNSTDFGHSVILNVFRQGKFSLHSLFSIPPNHASTEF